MSKITSFTEGHTSSGMMKWYAAILDCKHWHYAEGWQPFPANVTVGSIIPCSTCVDLANDERELEALDLSKVAYLRFDTRWAYPDQGIKGTYHAYRREPSSPSGVMLIRSFRATDAIDAIIDRKHICSMSPTEGRER